MNCYARLLAHHPYAVIAAVSLVVSICFIADFTLQTLPDFEDPQLGFAPRGTVLSQRETAWENLLDANKFSGPFTLNPLEYAMMSEFHKNFPVTSARSKRSSKRRVEMQTDEVTERFGIITQDENKSWAKIQNAKSRSMEDDWQILENLNENDHLVVRDGPIPQHFTISEFFCGEPSISYSRVIFSSVDGSNLLSAQSLRSMCSIDNSQLRSGSEFEELCVTTVQMNCCPTWSLSNYVVLLRNKTDCASITEEDVAFVLDMLKTCSKFYNNLQLRSDCYENEETCPGIPLKCTFYNAVYTILHYLTDINFLNELDPNNTHLTYAMSFLPVAASSKAMPYFRALEAKDLSNSITKVVAMNMGLKYTLFDEYLVHDTIYVGLAGVLIFLFMWMYTSSLLITFMTVLAIVFSVGIAYFLYVFVFRVKFFPFMNLLTSVIIIGVGADDAFIYCKVWACAKSEKNNGTLVKLVNDTLKHATMSMLVTSLTTATAFYTSYVSSITAIKCFSLFAGTTIIANFVLMVTWLPATIVIAERWCSSNCCICIPPFGLYAPPLQRCRICSRICNSLWKLHYHFTDWARIFFEKILPCIVIKLRFLWMTSLGAIALYSVVVVFYYPGLRLPDSKEFQIFSADHPFERYDLQLKDLFWFEKVHNVDVMSKMPVTVVWGVKPVDNGDYMDPLSKGTLVLDETFNVAKPESQKWLMEFCRELRRQEFYQSTFGPLLPNCFIETFKSWMNRRCVDASNERNRTPCCELSPFPYPEHVFNLCINQAVKALYETPAMYNFPGIAGPRFSKTTGKIQAVVIEYDSNQPFSLSYTEMDKFVNSVETWVKKKMDTAPVGMKNGWFFSYLSVYDLQKSLLYGTLEAIGVAMLVSFIVVFVTTLNFLISAYAILTIASIICVTIASLVLLGWKMNVLESIAVTVAIGLAVDFTLHYGVVYKLSPEDDRESSVIFSLSRMGSPIAMATFTTFLAGACMTPSSVLSYTQIGTFIMIIMSISWIYATFFFQSALRCIGPEKNVCQLHYPTVDCCSGGSNVHVDKTVYNYAVSESTLSTSSTSYPNQTNANETHELEPLTTKSERPASSGQKYVRLKKQSKNPRNRSGSLSVTFLDTNSSLSQLVSVSPRKISLPTATTELSPRHGLDATSSTTVVFSDEDREANTSNASGVYDSKEVNILI